MSSITLWYLKHVFGLFLIISKYKSVFQMDGVKKIFQIKDGIYVIIPSF